MSQPRKWITRWRLMTGVMFAILASATHWAAGQEYGPMPPALTAADLVRMSPAELDGLYRSANAGVMPCGKVKGRVIISPGSNLAPATSRVARLWWQGKVFREDGSTAVNRFLGIRIVEGSTYVAQSWMDERPSLILDYQHTSRIYRNVRDEIRQVGPNLYLGAMFERSQPAPTLTMYFILETSR
jgi:hypothetical protein